MERKKKINLQIVAAFVILLVTVAYLFIHLQTYTSVRTIASYESGNSGSDSYQEFNGGILKYSRDGISFVNRRGEEKWNQPYQIKVPVVEVRGDAAAVADKGGNDILVFNKAGLRGEIHTTLPVEKISVSSQGIVSAVLKDGNSARISCYDAAGSLLAELKTSFGGVGYPMDINISEDGETLMVSYMSIKDGVVSSTVNFYNFGAEGREENDFLTASESYEDMIVPSVFFLDKSVSAAVGDHEIILYKGQGTPEAFASIPLAGRIKSIFHDSRYIGVILKSEGEEGYELILYNRSGRLVMSEKFTGDYNHVKMSGNQIIMYNGKRCSVFLKNGIHKFEGEFTSSILEIIPVFGLNKYIVINADGMETIRFVK